MNELIGSTSLSLKDMLNNAASQTPTKLKKKDKNRGLLYIKECKLENYNIHSSPHQYEDQQSQINGPDHYSSRPSQSSMPLDYQASIPPDYRASQASIPPIPHIPPDRRASQASIPPNYRDSQASIPPDYRSSQASIPPMPHIPPDRRASQASIPGYPDVQAYPTASYPHP